jgi:ubiquinone biosynthesis protein COQ9
VKHAARIADEACCATGDKSLQVCPHLLCGVILADLSIRTKLEWYSRRVSLAAIYTAAGLFIQLVLIISFSIHFQRPSPFPELHQLTSPHTTYIFLDSLFDNSSSIKSSLDEVSLYSSYIFKSWRGIIKSSGIF